MSLLSVADLATTFDAPTGPIRVVDGVSFTLAPGETLGVVGESGSGKTMLVRSIMNLLPRSAHIAPQSEIRLDGRDLTHMSRAELSRIWGPEIAMVFQDPLTALNPVRRIGVQLTDPIRRHLGLSKRAARARAVDLLNEVGIPEPERRLDQYPHQLSGGMRQRIVIAIALSCQPRLLIADEPTTALDVTVQRQVLELLTRLQAEHRMAMVFITHDLGVVSGVADHIAVMYAGQFVETGTAHEIFESVHHPYTDALLRSIPWVERPSTSELFAIKGHPPDPRHLPPGCRFAPRCAYRRDECLTGTVELTPATRPPAEVRCRFPLTPTDEEGLSGHERGAQ
ncbi:ABC transporter ATP-binding protein [Candidatus Poriferisocius sp.]|uniref:ABC transporter ATP-binding protein n=1 Tax=Candidatus Poriferisocius sp. TaxID=3101276 RepID=UPI003B5C9F01